MPKIRVDGVRDAVAASLALRGVDSDLRKRTTADIRRVVNPMWRGVVQANASRKMDDRVLAKGARVATGARPALVAASSRRAFRGGLVPRDDWRGFEFGATGRQLKNTYRRRNRAQGGRHNVTRRTSRQMPARARDGRTLYPSVGDIGPRIFALWSQTAIRAVYDALERR